MSIGLLTLHLFFPGCTSLKQKRSLLKPVLARLHREFNVSAAEVARQDMWQEAVVVCAWVSNEAAFSQRALQQVVEFTEQNWPNIQILEHKIELI
jgi:uncharacterized protein